MTLLYIYIGTIAFFLISFTTFLIDCYKCLNLTEEEKKAYKRDGSIFRTYLKILVVSLIPLVNVAFGLITVFSDNARNEVVKRVELEVKTKLRII